MTGKLVRVNGKLVEIPEDHIPKDSTPKTIKWKGVPMMRSHSFLAAVGQGVKAVMATPLISHNITGMQGKGKSTLVASIAHATHKLLKKDYDIDFQVHHWGRDQLKNITESLKTVTDHSIISFDDISFTHREMKPAELNTLHDQITTIRHRPELGKDIRTILLYTTHYTKAITTLMRSAEFIWVVSCNSDIERDNINEMFGGSHKTAIWNFYIDVQNAIQNWYPKEGKFPRGSKRDVTHEPRWGPIGKNTPKGKKPKPMYAWRNPFGPVLFFSTSPRVIAYPSFDWLAPDGCGICNANTAKRVEHPESDVSDMIQPIMDSYGTGSITGLKAFLSKNNHWAFSPKAGKACRRFEKLLDDGVTVQQIKDWFDNYNKAKSAKLQEPRV